MGFHGIQSFRARSLLLIAAGWGLNAGSAWSDRVLDDFEGAGSPAPWTFSDGPEFPGATGSLVQTVGSNGKGRAARLSADFSKGGNYVSADFILPQPVTVKALSFRALASVGSRIVVRIRDMTGQTLQFIVPRPLTALDPNQWFLRTLTLDDPSSHFGGANDGNLHQPVKEIDFILEPLSWWRTDEKAPGSRRLDLDDVALMDSVHADLDPAVQPAPFAGSPTLDNLGINIHFTRNDSALDALANSGITWLRTDLGWSGIEKRKGVFDFSDFDALLASAKSRNLKLHLILDYDNPLYQKGPPTSAEAIAAFRAFAAAAAAHFRDKEVQYEIWNEPNVDQFWNPPDPKVFASLCKEGISGIHAGDPQALVSTAGTSETDWPFLQKLLAAGGAQGADALGVHPYRNTNPETMIEELLVMRSLVKDAFPNQPPPIWETEWGYPATVFGPGNSAEAQALQGRYDIRIVLSAWAAGFPFIVLYDLFNDGADPAEAEHNFGLLTKDYADKPAMGMIRTLARRTRGFTAKGFLPSGLSNLHALKLENATEILVVLWLEKQNELNAANTKDSVPVSFAMQPTAIWDPLGRGLAIAPPPAGGQGRFVRKAGYEPTYLLFSKTGSSVIPDKANAMGKAKQRTAGTLTNLNGVSLGGKTTRKTMRPKKPDNQAESAIFSSGSRIFIQSP